MEESNDCIWSLVVKLLDSCSQKDGVEYMLVTQDKQKGLDFQYSPAFGTTSKDKIENLLQEYTAGSLSLIKPAIKRQYWLHLSRQSTHELYFQYHALLSCISQLACKEIAKKWIKVVEPKKQKLYPYKDQNSSKPPWWPAYVDHIEPDHLEKEGRIQLLVCLLRNPSTPVSSLKHQTTHISFRYPVVQRLLTELYYLAYWDRAFHQTSGEESTSQHEGILLSDSVHIRVSDLQDADQKVGFLRVSQINVSQLNCSTYEIHRCLTGENRHTHQEDIAYLMSSPDKRRRIKKEESESSVTTDTCSEISSLCEPVQYQSNGTPFANAKEYSDMTLAGIYDANVSEHEPALPFAFLS